jgi:hypothetical protein
MYDTLTVVGLGMEAVRLVEQNISASVMLFHTIKE